MEFRFTDPAQDFADGIEVLRRYHEVFLKRGEDLLVLADDLRRDGMSEPRANRCVELHCFYLRANALHHRDEEHALFPLLLNRSALVDGMIERLALDHQEIEEAWEGLAGYLARPEQMTDSAGMMTSAQTFERLQREHLTREDQDFLLHVRTLLDPEQRSRMGSAMAELRKPTA